MTELLRESSQRPEHVDCFHRKAPLQTSDQIPNADPVGGVGGLQVHGIRSRRLVYKEVVEEVAEILLLVIWESGLW